MKRYRPDLKTKFIPILGDTDIIYDYINHANKESPSGEFGFRAIADDIYVYARYPTIERIKNLDLVYSWSEFYC